MRTSLMIILFAALLGLFAATEARYYKKINNDYVAYVDWVRGKRQSHPESTLARIPQIPFVDSSSNDALPPSGGSGPVEAVPAPSEYLTPPAREVSPRQSSPQQQQQQHQQSSSASAPSDKWQLGYEAGEILVPPVPDEHASEYETLRLFTLLPTSSEPQDEMLDGFGPAEQELAADSRTPFVDSYRPEDNSQDNTDNTKRERDEPQQNEHSSVYTFVKTNPHGHFKWGVHIGQ